MQGVLRVQWLGHEVRHSPPSSAEVNNGANTYVPSWHWQGKHFKHDHSGPARKLSTNLYDIPLLSLQWINSWWWTDELSEKHRVSCQNKFVKLVHLVGFIIKKKVLGTLFISWIYKCLAVARNDPPLYVICGKSLPGESTVLKKLRWLIDTGQA
jgi:hypothetical protein